jgi:hypothetical protein
VTVKIVLLPISIGEVSRIVSRDVLVNVVRGMSLPREGSLEGLELGSD